MTGFAGAVARRRGLFLSWLMLKDRPDAISEWGYLTAEAGVLFLTFGWLERLRDMEGAVTWDDVAWLTMCTVVGFILMRVGVKMRTRRGR